MKTSKSPINNTSSPHHLFAGEGEILNQWTSIEKSFHSHVELDSGLLAHIKISMSNANASNFSTLSQQPRKFDLNQKRMEYARAFAVMFAIAPDAVIPQHFRLLNEVFSKSEIAELCAFVCYTYSTLQFCSLIQYR